MTKPMDLTTCACLLASAELMDNAKGEKVDVIRPYTPISTNNQVGCFDLLIKDYGENGWLSKYMCEDLPIGGTVRRIEAQRIANDVVYFFSLLTKFITATFLSPKINFKHIDFNVSSIFFFLPPVRVLEFFIVRVVS